MTRQPERISVLVNAKKTEGIKTEGEARFQKQDSSANGKATRRLESREIGDL